jgi:FixJ family two-component response regulator
LSAGNSGEGGELAVSWTGAAERRSYLENGMTDCVAKPIDAGTLLAAIHRAIETEDHRQVQGRDH